ncbi:hypothetical protein [Candidatus Thiosymbion oneisti]|uniref:hypothetical protein n=1 Tax=Candidatus Thiosymbion oneisti TaxID=589554 RepID=UPI001060D898|nr:hypothetical protein [Candidatus Thiosymbion oneisti]
MLIIRPEQIRQLHELLDEKYCLELGDYFRTTYPQQTAEQDDEALLEIITASVRHARSLNIVTADALLRFVGIAVLVNPRFYDDAKVKELFAEEAIDADYKVHVLSEQLITALHAASES